MEVLPLDVCVQERGKLKLFQLKIQSITLVPIEAIKDQRLGSQNSFLLTCLCLQIVDGMTMQGCQAVELEAIYRCLLELFLTLPQISSRLQGTQAYSHHFHVTNALALFN